MQGSSTSTAGEICLAAYQRVLGECNAFRAAKLFLIEMHLGSMRESGILKEAYDQFVEYLKPHYATPSRYFVERSFISLVAAFELYMQDVITAIVLANPKKVGQVEFKLSEILDASGHDELVRRGIDATLNKIMYKKPMEYLVDVASLLSIDDQPLRAKWPIFVEAKARRDLGVHNGWRCNAIYLRKISEIGMTSRFANGESAFPVDETYLNEIVATISELSGIIIQAVIAKHPASLNMELK